MCNNTGELNFENSPPQVLFPFRKPEQVTILVGQTINLVVRLILVSFNFYNYYANLHDWLQNHSLAYLICLVIMSD